MTDFKHSTKRFQPTDLVVYRRQEDKIRPILHSDRQAQFYPQTAQFYTQTDKHNFTLRQTSPILQSDRKAQFYTKTDKHNFTLRPTSIILNISFLR